MITVNSTGLDEAVASLTAAVKTVDDVVTQAVERVGKELVQHVQKDYLSGQSLNARLGRLRASIAPGHSESLSGISRDGDNISYQVGSSVPYAAIWEHGGSIPGYTVYPRTASVLRFMAGGSPVFTKYANIPARSVVARPYLQPAVEDMRDDFAREIQEAVETSLKKEL